MSFEQAIRAAGLIPREVIADGKIHRCDTTSKPGRRNGWYVLHADGHGAWGDWASGSGEALGTWSDQTAANIKAIDPKVLEQRRQRERANRLQAIGSARAFWNNARPLNRPHPYLERKGLTPLGCAGLRQHDGMLVVPVLWKQSLISIQTITVDGQKRFWPGAPVKAGCYVIDRPRAAVTVLVEGLATGLACFQSVRQARVIVAFDCGNLVNVVDLLRPNGSVVIAADNDWKTAAKRGMNPGIEKATNAAELIGCGVVWPREIEGSDWCDLLTEYGAPGARHVERSILAAAKYVVSM